MKTRYNAFERLMIVPLELYVLATSGMADSTAVDEMGARNPQNERTPVIIIFRFGENLS